MSGALVLRDVPDDSDGQRPSVVIERGAYPMIKLYKRDSTTNGHDFRIYIAGPAGDLNPNLALAATDDAGNTNYAVRLYANGVLKLAADPLGVWDAVTKQYADAGDAAARAYADQVPAYYFGNTSAAHTLPSGTTVPFTGYNQWVAKGITYSGSTFTVSSTGFYAVTALAIMNSPVTSARAWTDIVWNGASGGYNFRSPFGNEENWTSTSMQVFMAAGETFQHRIYQKSGASMGCNFGMLGAVKIGIQ